MPFVRRGGRPGLIGLAARTAVVSATSSAVHNSMSARQRKKSQAEYEQQQYEAAQQQLAMQQAVAQNYQQQAATPSRPDSNVDLVAELQKLGSLKDAGLLSDEEFAAAKAKLLDA